MKIIGIIGSKSSGKETAAEYIAANYNGESIAHSDILFEILSLLHISKTRDNVIKLSALRERFGADTLINALNHKISEIKKPLVVVTGIRFENELKNVQAYPDHIIISITTPIEVRYKRQIHRSSRVDDKTMSFEEFVMLENRNTEIGISELAKQANYTIDNSGTLEEFHNQLDTIVKEFVK